MAIRFGANEEEQVANGAANVLTCCSHAPLNCLKHAIMPFESADLRLCHHLDVGEASDAVDQVARHAGRQVLAAHDQPHLRSLGRQVHGGLAGGISGTDECNLLARDQFALERRSPVVNAGRLVVLKVGYIEAPVASAAGYYDRARPDRFAIEQAKLELAVNFAE